jgi:ElaB/YqjD/DUF883 family membrane-anchored ribosome-binding protein
MDTIERENSEQSELRAKLDAAIERARAVCERLQDKTVECAKATDQTVRDHPYHAMGMAFGLGILIGVLVGRRGRD